MSSAVAHSRCSDRSEHFPELPDRVGGLPVPPTAHRQKVRQLQIGLEANGFGQVRDGFLDASVAGEREAEIHVDQRVVRVEHERLSDSATASSARPTAPRAMPRLLCVSATAGSRRRDSRYCIHGLGGPAPLASANPRCACAAGDPGRRRRPSCLDLRVRKPAARCQRLAQVVVRRG